jgi:hypothetical protein
VEEAEAEEDRAVVEAEGEVDGERLLSPRQISEKSRRWQIRF